MNSPTKPNRPTLTVMIAIYTVWIGSIVAIFTIPSLSFLGVLAAALVLFVWLPYWARMNWSFVVEDMPATYATIIVSVILMVLLGFIFRYDAKTIGWRLVQSGWLEPRELGWLNFFEFVLHMGVFFSISPTWRWLRRVFARTPSGGEATHVSR
ncbi:MAG: hypothetical protein H7A55_09320 [Verrucomicrobiaceae bacterium]|nr:hypothetical protein [Verrucomicrobiaceae bacterium]